MTDLLCTKCNNDILKNIDSENIYNYLDIIKKEIDKDVIQKIIFDVNLCDVEEILNDYIKICDNKYNFYFVNCTFDILFDDDNHILYTTYEHNTEIYKLIIQLQFFIDIMKTKNKIFNKINQITINILRHNCNMTDEYSNYMRYSCIERRINQLSGKYPNILKNNFLIKNKSHIIFNI